MTEKYRFLELAAERYSARKFRNDPVPQETIDKILKAGALAPTACNNQPQKVLVIRSEEALAKLKNVTRFHFDAPLAIMTCVEEAAAWTRKYDQKSSSEIDASIVATHMMLEAWDLGVGSTWVMVFDPVKAREEFGIPEGVTPVGLLIMGYPAEDCPVSPLHAKSRTVEEMTVYDHF